MGESGTEEEVFICVDTWGAKRLVGEKMLMGVSKGGKLVVVLQPGPGSRSKSYSNMGYWNKPLSKGKGPTVLR